MGKWIGVRLCGWLAWCALILAGAGLALGRIGVQPGALNASAIVFITLTCVFFFAWFVGSVFTWALRRQAAFGAAPLAARPAPAHLAACAICHRAAPVMLCSVHGVAVCIGCLDLHDSPACAYVTVAVHGSVVKPGAAGAGARRET